MRIALVTETFLPTADGTTTTVKAVLDRLVDLGHDVLVVAPGPGLTTYRGCRVARVHPLERRGAQVREALDLFGPDLVHATSPRALGRRAVKHAHRAGVPVVVVEQSALLDVTLDHWRSRAADRADRVLVTSRWMVDRVAEGGVPAALWQPGVDTAAFTPALRDEWLHRRWARSRSAAGPLVVVGYVGSLRDRHDVRRLATLGCVPGIRPVVIGDGPQRDWLERRLPGARFVGALGTGDLTVALPSLDSEAIAAIVAARRERPYTTLEDFRARTARGTATADTTGLSVGSRHFLVTVVARQGHAVARAQALVARSDGQRSTVIWQVVD